MTWLVVLLVLGYAGWWLLPFTACWRCNGARRNAGSNARRWGKCRACGGSGEWMRFGARTLHRVSPAGASEQTSAHQASSPRSHPRSRLTGTKETQPCQSQSSADP